MRDIWLRLILAALVSASGVMATYGWSRLHRVSVAPSAPEPVARLSSSTKEVLRRPAQRMIWQSILRDQELYPGEAVRTTSESEARIEFLGQGTVVQLDPDTVIEIEKNENGINLDFLRGNLFIRSLGVGDKITVKSGQETLAVNNAEVAISKPEPEARLQVDVIKGEAKVIAPDQASMPSLPKLKILAPQPGHFIYLKPDSDERANFDWQPIDASYEVTVEAGSSRTALKSVGTAAGSLGRLAGPLAIGKNYFRLVGKSKKPGQPVLSTSVFRLDVRAKIPPLLLEGGATLRWANPGRLEEMIVETARSADLKTELKSKAVGDRLQLALDENEAPGTIYWRVSGRLPGTQQLISSSVQKFDWKIAPKPEEPLLAPALATPESGKAFDLLSARISGVKMTWSTVKGATGYELTLVAEQVEGESEAKTYLREAKSQDTSVQNLRPGVYKWSVVAKDEIGRKSPVSEERKFIVEGVPILSWSDGKTEEKIVYKTKEPLLRASWNPGSVKPSSWRVRISGERQPASDQDWKLVSAPRYETSLSQPGTYKIEAEAVDSSGVVIARVPARTIEFSQAPPLAPPTFADGDSGEIMARDNGSVDIEWRSVSEAKQYVLSVKSKDGVIIRSMKSSSTTASLSELKTGEYQVTLQTVDSLGRLGPESSARTLRVPEYSSVRAPKLKSVNVK